MKSERLDKMETEPSKRPARVLLVDDELFFAKAVRTRLEKAGFSCGIVDTLEGARKEFAAERPDIILLDMRLPDGSGLDFLSELREGQGADVPVVVLTAHGELEDAVAAMKLDAVDYLKKPADLDELLLTLAKVRDKMDLTQRLAYSREREIRSVEAVELLGESPAIRQVREQLARVAKVTASVGDSVPPTVLVLGETGTGKDVVARLLHLHSARAERPFVHVDCGSLPDDLIESELFGHERGAFTNAYSSRAGLIEAAEDGTVFLDEIAELPAPVQSKLLAFLGRRTVRRLGGTRERPVSAWVIAATNRDLAQMIEQGRFRADLYYRLDQLNVSLPPLRQRGDDIPLLAKHFATQTARRFGMPEPEFSNEALRALRSYSWPGNVRELKHLVERAVLLSEGRRLEASAFFLQGTAGAPVTAGAEMLDDLTLDEAEGLLIGRALRNSGGNVSEAARRLGITRMALRYRMEKHGLSRSGEKQTAHVGHGHAS